MERSAISRRGALTGAASVGLVPVLAACGEDEPDAASEPAPSSESPETSESPEPTPEKTRKSERDKPADQGLASAADVPIGGGLILAEKQLVITQPRKGDFKGFTAVCTHQGCTVSKVTDTISCPCHGSQFSITDGSVVGGPAPSPLAQRRLVVDGDAINLAEERS